MACIGRLPEELLSIVLSEVIDHQPLRFVLPLRRVNQRFNCTVLRALLDTDRLLTHPNRAGRWYVPLTNSGDIDFEFGRANTLGTDDGEEKWDTNWLVPRLAFRWATYCPVAICAKFFEHHWNNPDMVSPRLRQGLEHVEAQLSGIRGMPLQEYRRIYRASLCRLVVIHARCHTHSFYLLGSVAMDELGPDSERLAFFGWRPGNKMLLTFAAALGDIESLKALLVADGEHLTQLLLTLDQSTVGQKSFEDRLIEGEPPPLVHFLFERLWPLNAAAVCGQADATCFLLDQLEPAIPKDSSMFSRYGCHDMAWEICCLCLTLVQATDDVNTVRRVYDMLLSLRESGLRYPPLYTKPRSRPGMEDLPLRHDKVLVEKVRTAFCEACAHGKVEIARYLAERFRSLTEPGQPEAPLVAFMGNILIQLAGRGMSDEIYDLLLRLGAQLHLRARKYERNTTGEMAMLRALGNGHINLVKKFAPEVTITDRLLTFRDWISVFAVDDVAVIRILVENGLDLQLLHGRLVDAHGDGMLSACFENDARDIARELVRLCPQTLTSGFCFDCVKAYPMRGSAQVLRVFINEGAQVSGKRGMLLPYVCLMRQWFGLAVWLVEQGVEIDRMIRLCPPGPYDSWPSVDPHPPVPWYGNLLAFTDYAALRMKLESVRQRYTDFANLLRARGAEAVCDVDGWTIGASTPWIDATEFLAILKVADAMGEHEDISRMLSTGHAFPLAE